MLLVVVVVPNKLGVDESFFSVVSAGLFWLVLKMLKVLLFVFKEKLEPPAKGFVASFFSV